MASDDLKRVGLVFTAEGTTDFKKSLSNVNAAMSENRAQHKLIKSTWDESTRATEKLKDTQSYLAKQYEASKNKVNILRTELQEMEKDENANKDAITKKRTALANAETTMNNYKNGLDEVNAKLKSGSAKIKEYADQLQKVGDRAKKAGTALTKGVTAPLIAIGTGAMAAWNEIDSAYDNIVAGTGATGDALSELQNVFDDVFGSMPVDAEEASNAVADLNTRFGFTDEALSKASKKFLEFAEVNKTDVSSAIQLVSRAMGDASIDSSEYNSVLDALTAASQASGISIEKLTENLTKYGAPMRALGFDTQESIAIFAQWEKAGVNTEIAFSGMKKAISNWSASGKDARVEFQKTLKEIENCPDIASATTKAIEVFGTKAGPDLADAIQGGRFSIEDMMKVVEQSGGIVSQSFNDMQDPADKAKVSLNNLKLVGAELGDVIQSALGPIFEGLSNILKDIKEWFTGLDDSVKTMIVTFGAVVGAIGPLLVVIGTLCGSVGKIMGLFAQFKLAAAGASTATGILGTSFSTLLLPITAIIAVVALVVAAIVELWNTNESFRASVESAISSIQAVFNELWEVVLKPIFDILKSTLQDIWDNGIKPLWDNWVEFVGNIMTRMMELWTSIEPIVMWFIDVFGPSLVNVFNYVADIFSNVVNTILDVAGVWLDTIGEIIDGITEFFQGIIDFITGVFTGDWDKAWNGIVSIFEGIFNTIVGIAKTPINLVIGLINGMVGGVEAGINFVIRGINKLSFTVPKWVPGLGGKHFGFDLGEANFGRIQYLAKGGQLLNGAAIVAEAGPELLRQEGNRTTVTPLTRGGGAKPVDMIDYDKLTMAFIKALKYISIRLDDREMGEFVDDRVLKAVM